MSRGSGRLQARVLTLLETTPEGKKTRKELDDVLVKVEKFDPSNVLRAIKGLARKRLVGFTEEPRKEDSVVTLPRKVRLFTDDEISDLLAKTGGRK